jgi:large subunit ribosomal protein L4
MPVIKKIDESGTEVGEYRIADALVESEVNVGLVHEVVRAELAAHRQGTSKAKSRGEVVGSGAKPWRQKGTGRARAGSIRVPHWTGGGVAFPPVPRSYEFKVNKKVRAKAYRMALGDLVDDGAVKVLSGVAFSEPSTKRAAAILEAAGLEPGTLVIGTADEVELLLSFRNLPGTRVLPLAEVEVQDYVWATNAVVTEAALASLEGGDR